MLELAKIGGTMDNKMQSTKIATVLIVQLVLIVGFTCSSEKGKKKLAADVLKKIAIQEAQKSGLALDNYEIIVNANNAQWTEKSSTFNLNDMENAELLESTDFQAVCFQFKEKPGMRGNNIWYFFDKSNGKLLNVFSEELPYLE